MATMADGADVRPETASALPDAAVEMESLLQALWECKGSDLMITPGSAPILRLDGELVRLHDLPMLTPADTERLAYSILSSRQREELETRKELDFSFSWQDQARFRVNAFRQRGSVAVAMRMIPYELPDFDDLRLPHIVRGLTSLPQGLVLVTGATGSGKSTTLAAMIDAINSSRPCHILTIEDPIEYVHRHKVAAVNQREVGEDTESFSRGLRSALREDPDVLLIGEMRDLETIQTALTIAETGHLVFATLHTNDSAQAIDRVVDVFPGDAQAQIRVQLSNALQAVVYQRLLPRTGGGRVAAFEVMLASSAIRNLIREGKTRQLRNAVATATREGMQTLEMSLSELVMNGLVPYEQARAASLYPNEVARPA
jgi:twitching motility protein PilT